MQRIAIGWSGEPEPRFCVAQPPRTV